MPEPQPLATPRAGVPTQVAPPPPASAGDRTRFAFLAETSRCLADTLDLEATLVTVASLALPHFGAWCMVDVVESDESISRVAVIHPDPARQAMARDFYRAHPPQRDEPIGAPRVIRTRSSEFAPITEPDVLGAVADPSHRDVLRELGARSSLTVPMRARGRTLGAITFVSDELRDFDDADLLLAEDLGRRCAMAIDNARLYGAAKDARRAAEDARETATFTAQRANTLRELAEHAQHEAEVANRAKASFLTTMSHEFRTPLGAILGFVGLLDDELAGPLTVQQRDYLRRIGNASGSLLRLIEEVLTLSRVHAGHGSVLVEEVDLSAILHEVADLFLPLVAARHVRLIVDVPHGAVRLATDGPKFRQIVINLVGNAVKFTPRGEVRVSLAATGTGVALRVADTGEGISAADAERLFEPFTQASAPGHSAPRGTGLGLAITRQLAQLMGGDVALTSTPGEGSTFTVDLPALDRLGAVRGAVPGVEARAAELRERRAVERAPGVPRGDAS